MTGQPIAIPHGEALARLQRGYMALFALVEDFPEGRRELAGACGDWSPRQVLAHLCGWMQEGQVRFRQILAGDKTSRQYDRDSDHAAFNEAAVRSRAGASWDAMVAELRQRADAFYAEASAIERAGLAGDVRVRDWLDWLWHHCIEHMGQLSRFALA